jgi:hypothetical protein
LWILHRFEQKSEVAVVIEVVDVLNISPDAVVVTFSFRLFHFGLAYSASGWNAVITMKLFRGGFGPLVPLLLLNTVAVVRLSGTDRCCLERQSLPQWPVFLQ